jgi:transcriptional regulator with XRE-family HTH domain
MKEGVKLKVNFQKLQIAMANACMNKSDLADSAEISRISISKYFSGKRQPSPKTIGKIAKALNVDVTEIIDAE